MPFLPEPARPRRPGRGDKTGGGQPPRQKETTPP